MIVRIAGDAQYTLDEGHHEELDDLDDAVVAAVEAGDESGFTERFAALLSFVRANGALLPDDDLHPSDIILPPEDLTFAEAGADFSGEGLVPDPA